MGFNSLKDVLQEQLEDLYSAETQLTAALPKMAQAAHHDELREAFEQHLQETHDHLKRVKEALGEMGVSSPTEVCQGMKGLIAEGEKLMHEQGDPMAQDAADVFPYLARFTNTFSSGIPKRSPTASMIR